MKLTELNPSWTGHGGEGMLDKDRKPIPFRGQIGVAFDCPCGTHGEEDYGCCRVFVAFENPPDGGPPLIGGGLKWKREGDTFETMTLQPSILRKTGCGWHGFVTDGNVTTCDS